MSGPTPAQIEVYELQQMGLTRQEIAQKTGRSERAIKQALERYRRWEKADSALAAGAKAIGADTPAKLVWTKTDKDGNKSYSVLHVQGDESADFCEVLKGGYLNLPPLTKNFMHPGSTRPKASI